MHTRQINTNCYSLHCTAILRRN